MFISFKRESVALYFMVNLEQLLRNTELMCELVVKLVILI